MKIYLDDNFTDRALAGGLRHAGHSVAGPEDFGLSGAPDARHLACAVQNGFAVLTKDKSDFEGLHALVQVVGGRHCGIVAVSYANDAKRDMKIKHIIRAIDRFERSGAAIVNEWVILNHWR